MHALTIEAAVMYDRQAAIALAAGSWIGWNKRASSRTNRGRTLPVANSHLEAESEFLRLLRSGHPFAFEDAAKLIRTPEGFDRRALGVVPARMHRDGEIVKAGYRTSESAKHHAAIKQLWRLA